MKVKELISAMDNIVELVHLYYGDGGQVPSSLGVYNIYI